MSAVEPQPAETLTFDGAPVPFVPGQTIGAALAAAGIVSWRTTRRDRSPRGLFCGIGVCFDCLVTVDGARTQRACLAAASEGQDVRSSDPDEPLRHPEASHD
jgi:predicted molibdopterin-dependent oxidoreductase YjgC